MAEEKKQSILGELYNKLFGSHWEMWVGSLLLAAMSVGLFLFKQPFGASCSIMSWGNNIYYDINPDWAVSAGGKYLSMCAWGIITVFVGSMGASFLSKEYSIKVAPVGELVKGLIGGLFMAFGAVLGKGCTLGSFFSGWASLSAGALTFAPGLAIGVFIAAKWLVFEVDKFPKISGGKSWNVKIAPNSKIIQPIIGVVIIALGLMFPLFFRSQMEANAAAGGTATYIIYGFMVISVFMGIVLQRSRWCIVRALREPFMSGDSKPAVAIILGILVSMFGIVAFKYISPVGSAIEMTFVFPNFWLRGLMGGAIFGIGMTLAGGCAVGSVWRAGEGHVKLGLATLVMTFMMPFVKVWFLEGPLVGFLTGIDTAQQKIFLPTWFETALGVTRGGGYALSMLLISVCCLIWYIFVKWNDRTRKLAAY